MVTDAEGGRGTAVLELDLETASLEERKTPTTLFTLAVNVLTAHTAPEKVIVGEGLPCAGDLGCAAKRYGVKVAEDAEGDFAGEKGEGVNADDPVQRVREMGQLRAGCVSGGRRDGMIFCCRTHKQHIVKMPSRISLRLLCGAAEKVDHSDVIAARSATGNESSDCGIVSVRPP